MNAKARILAAMGVVAFCIWSAMAYYDPSLRGDYVKFVISVVVGITALVLRDMPAPPQSKPPQE